ncbi:MAG: hypothetical protein RLP09_42700 [Sandaracinaceae bacterium]|nr:MAG: hypothetical protein EVA89_37600 [Sandaracinaceae bacterium]
MSSRAWVALLLLSACDPAPVEPGCADDGDCAPGERCADAVCVPSPDAGMTDDAGPDDAGVCDCGAGEVCRDGACGADCGDPGATPCGAGRVCDYATGECADEGASGILTGEGVRCGDDGPLCLPGTECALDGTCAAAPPCFATRCTEDGAACWGRSCLTRRPAGACTPAPLDRMNMDDFLRGGDGGAFDLELDDACNAYVVTMISGTDYLRQLSPDGTLTIWNGVTNLNMGEVAVRRIEGDEFGTGDGEGQVGLTYVCCAACGCVSSDPQGVARLDRADPSASLPMVITAMPSPGEGPFQRSELDTGPYGLTWGRDNTLYVGNVTAQGDLVRADLDAGSTEEIHRLPARIHASAVFDRHSLLVAVDEGVVHRVATDSALTEVWAEVGEDVTSLVRDPFTGRIFISVTSARILEYTPDGTLLGEWESPGERGRLAYSPDGYLYYLISGWPTRAEVLRYALPETL